VKELPEISIQHLPCFLGKKIQIDTLKQGYSRPCFKVSILDEDLNDKVNYFVKELGSSADLVNQELNITSLASGQKLCPKLAFYNENFLVTEYIDSKSLDDINWSTENKIVVTIPLMAQLHDMNADNAINNLVVKNVSIKALLIDQVDQVIQADRALEQNKDQLLLLVERITAFKCSGEQVLCHGDLNFSNVLVDKNQQAWLIDYECAHKATIEYDIAMFIAINLLPINTLEMVIQTYKTFSGYTPDSTIINLYLPCCYLLNAMWFSQNKQLNLYHKLAIQQSEAFQKIIKKTDVAIVSLSNLLDLRT